MTVLRHNEKVALFLEIDIHVAGHVAATDANHYPARDLPVNPGRKYAWIADFRRIQYQDPYIF
jgi:hypothetical protein